MSDLKKAARAIAPGPCETGVDWAAVRTVRDASKLPADWRCPKCGDPKGSVNGSGLVTCERKGHESW